MIKVLVTSAGVMSAVNIIKALKLQSEINIHIIASDMDLYAPGLYLADEYYKSPALINQNKYLTFISDVVIKKGIDIIIPCYSKEIKLFSENKDHFESLGAKMILPSPKAIDLCDNKLHSINLVNKLGIPVPEILENPTDESLPIFSKLSKGSGSEGAVYISNKHLLENALTSKGSRIYQEYIDGQEYTVDLISNYNKELLVSCPRKRLLIKAGQSVKGITIKSKRLSKYSEIICKEFGLVGVSNIQFIKRRNQYYFIEVNPRYASGGLLLTVNAGVNLPLIALKLILDIKVNDNELIHRSNIIMSRFWNAIFLDEGKINNNNDYI
tara:strand:+ start:75 stop:1052 length:978 start_codon:yes stop_codon:yes gene_type:complete